MVLSSGASFAAFAVLSLATPAAAETLEHAETEPERHWIGITVDAACVSASGVVRKCTLVEGETDLQAQEIVLVGSSSGLRFRGKGERLRAGLAFGTRPRTATIVWDQTVYRQSHEIGVPTPSAASWVAFQSSVRGRVQISVLTELESEQHYWDFIEQHVLGEGESSSPDAQTASSVPPDSTAALVASLWREARDMAGEDAVHDGLFYKAQELRARLHRLRAPFYVSGERVTDVVIEKGERWASSHVDGVWSLGLRGAAGTPTTALVSDARGVVAQMRWSGTERPREGFSASKRILRLEGKISLHLLEGSMEIDGVAYLRRRNLLQTRRALTGSRKATGFAATLRSLSEGQATAWSRAKGQLRVLPEGSAALLRAEMALAAPSREQAAEAGFDALASTVLGPHWKALVAERLLDLGLDAPAARCGALLDEVVAQNRPMSMQQALEGSLCEGGTLPVASLRALQAQATRHPTDPWLRRVVRVVARRHLRLRTLDEGHPQGTVVRPIERSASADHCSPRGIAGPRWTVLQPGKTEVVVTGANRRTVSIRTLEPRRPWEGLLYIDRTPVPVHGAAGLTSVVSVPVGRRVLRLTPEAPPLLARLPRSDRVSCEGLRDVFEWDVMDRSRTYSIDTSAETLGFARVRLTSRRGSLRGTLSVITGGREHGVTILGGPSARFEVPIQAHAKRMTVLAESMPSGLLVSVQTQQDSRTTAALADTADTDEDEETLLSVVRETSRAIYHGAVGDSLRALRIRRARALESLGYARYAYIDREATGTTPERRSLIDRSGVYPLNEAARTPPLRIVDAERLSLGQRLAASGAYDHALEVLQPPVQESAGALLAAVLRERSGRATEAASAWERVGTANALARAARIELAHGVRAHLKESSVKALVLATASESLGVFVPDVLARVGRRVRWIRPATAVGSHGSMSFRRPLPKRTDSLAASVRRSLLDAPESSYLIYEGERIQIKTRLASAASFSVAGRCLAPRDDAPCHLKIAVSGVEVGEAGPAPQEIRIDEGEYELTVEPTAGAMAWVELGGLERHGVDHPVVHSLAYEAAPEAPLRFAALGPTVLRMDLSSLDPQAMQFGIFVNGKERRAVNLPRSTGDEPLSVEVPILDAGSHEVTVVSSGRARIYPRVAVPYDAPRASPPRPEQSTEPTPSIAPPYVQAPPADDAPLPGDFSLSSRAMFVQAALGDLDVAADGTPYLELSTALLRAVPLEGRHGHVSLRPFVRLRDGSPSLGFQTSLETPPEGLRPRTLSSLRFTAQPGSGLRAGIRAHTTSVWSLPWSPWVAFHPFVGLDVRLSSGDPSGADPDASSRFAAQHPWTPRFGFVLRSRPFLDVVGRIRSQAMLNPDGTPDRLETGIQLDNLFRVGWPLWTTLEYRASQRFADSNRNDSFLRHMLGARVRTGRFWFGEHQVVFFSEAAWVSDRRELFWLVGIEHLASPRRGAQDVPGRDAEFEYFHRDAAIAPGLLRPDELDLVRYKD